MRLSSEASVPTPPGVDLGAMIKIAALILAWMLLHGGLAQANGVALLKLENSPSALALGQGSAANLQGASAMGLNPAGLIQSLSRSPRPQLLASYSRHIADTQLQSLGYAHPLKEWAAVGVSHLRLDSGSLDGRDNLGNPTGGFKAQDSLTAAHLAAKLPAEMMGVGPSHLLQLGLSAKLLKSQIGSFSAQTQAFDLGLQYHNLADRPWSLGLTVRNMGAGLRFSEQTDPLPTAASLSASLSPLGALSVYGHATRNIEERKTEFGFGTGLSVAAPVSLRASYLLPQKDALSKASGASPLAQLAFGLGLKINAFSLDYSLVPLSNEALGVSHRVAFLISFGGEGRRAAASKARGRGEARRQEVSEEAVDDRDSGKDEVMLWMQ